MKHTWIYWLLSIALLCSLAFFVSSPAMAEEAESGVLPLDMLVPGKPAKEEGWINKPEAQKGSTWSGDYTEYEDSTIHMVAQKSTYVPHMNKKDKNVEIETILVRVQIKDASQIRTAMSYDSYKKREYQEADKMAQKKNAILAINGDFFKYYNNVGYVVRQGEFYRDATNGRFQYDMLVIDDQGDLWVVPEATTKSIEDFIKNTLPEGRSIINTFNVGPALVIDGQVQDVSQSIAAKKDLFQWNIPQQRICIVQMGPLDYAIVETYGHYDGTKGLQLQEFAEYVASVCPDAILAYNLDGGGSTNVVGNGVRLVKTPGKREISDILYFASAED